MSKYFYYQEHGGEEVWKPCPVLMRDSLEAEKSPAFFTALSVSQLADDLPSEDRDKLKYLGPLYFDWDGEDMLSVSEQVHKLCLMLEGKGLDMACAQLYATGGRGFHLEVPMGCFMAKIPKDGVQHLPLIYKQLAFELAVDNLDFRVYSGGRGRMWRSPNVRRDNGHYKVPITYAELQAMTAESYSELTAAPRKLPDLPAPKLSMELMVMFDHAQQTVTDRLKRRKKKNTDPAILRKQELPSLEALLDGRGIKTGTGFHQISLQLAIVADAMGWKEEELVAKAEGLVSKHVSDSNRYNSEGKRRTELLRMHRYISDNPCYEFSIGGLKSLLNHDAPDLDGIPVTREEIAEDIEKAAAADAEPKTSKKIELDEYGDVASIVDLTKYGVYIDTEEGKRRICALAFENVHILRSPQTGQVSCYEADILINGKFVGRQTLELDVFGGLQPFNRFAGRHSHALQGNDAHVRGLMMRVAEKGKKEGKTYFVLNREGLDMINVVNHEDPDMREPFMVWADNKGVVLEPRIAQKGYEFSFQGYPDPRGSFRTDISDAPKLVDWLDEPGNKEVLRSTLQNFLTCQQPTVISKMIGWYTACFYRMLFHKVYSKFPILHINGAAGAGKCLAPDTPVLLASGRTALAREVRTGDLLLGPDGTPRKVLSTCTGREQMYRVVPVKGDPYVVNASHILSLARSGKPGVVNMNVVDYYRQQTKLGKSLKGWRAGCVQQFPTSKASAALLLDPYWLGCWLGDGKADQPVIYKPEATAMLEHLTAWAYSQGHRVARYAYKDGDCPGWLFSTSDSTRTRNGYLDGLRGYGLVGNKHVPDDYKYGSADVRRALLAGMVDSDGSVSRGGFDWISKYEQLADDFAFICRSLGLAAYKKLVKKGIKSSGFEGAYWRVSVSGDCSQIPCLDKVAPARKQVKRVTVTGIRVERLGVGDYCGFELDGDKLFLLGDFTVTHNTEMSKTLLSFFYYQQEPKTLTPGSTLFAIQQHLAGSASIPLIIDEYKPHEMPIEMHGKLKLLMRDAYNCRDVTRGGGNRDSDDYRSLYATQLAAPMVVIAEASEEEAAVMERVVLCTIVRPPASVAMKWSNRFHLAERNKRVLAILGQYIASSVVLDYSVESLTEEFDKLQAQAQAQYMLSEKDLSAGLSEDELRAKQGAKERTVFNYTVVRFGLGKFRTLVKDIFDDEFEPLFAELEDAVYNRMNDLLPSTQPEWVKVFNRIATMSLSVESSSPVAIRRGFEYAYGRFRGRNALELSARSAYHRYRAYCRSISERPLFSGDHAFLHSLKDCPALLQHGPGEELAIPGGVFIFDVDELARMGVEAFKP